MSVKSRLKEFLKHNRVTVQAFEQSINVSNGYVNSISKNIGVDKIELLLEKYPNINLDWLFTGKGNMFKTQSEMNNLFAMKVDDEQSMIDKNRLEMIELLKFKIDTLEEKLQDKENANH